MSPRSHRFALFLGLMGLLAASACTRQVTKRRTPPVQPDLGDDVGDELRVPAPQEPEVDAGHIDTKLEGRPRRSVDEEPDSGAGTDGGPTVCTGPIAPGDLAIVEILVASSTSAQDRGEWVEIANTRTCSLNLKGVRVESPRSDGPPDVAFIAGETLLPPGATFVVAGSVDPVMNHGLTGLVVSWEQGDVLDDGGDTISIVHGGVVVDRLTYPDWATERIIGRSVSFPSDCAWSDRPSWSRWSFSFSSYSSGLRGTPNRDNIDVTCF